MAGEAFSTRRTFDFLKDLEENNDRDWFAANKERYETHVKAASLRFIEAFAPHLEKLSPHFLATPRSLFRIYRDTRFSKDKSPYKTHTGIHFRHEQAKNAHAPGYYLHIAPGEVFAGVGIWRPESKPLRAIREYIVEEPKAWRTAIGGKAFKQTLALEGDRLQRAPKGFDPEHDLVDDLKRKDFIALATLSQKFVTDPALPRKLAKTFKAGSGLMGFLCDALGVPF